MSGRGPGVGARAGGACRGLEPGQGGAGGPSAGRGAPPAPGVTAARLPRARVPKRPVINTPVVSISVHDDEELPPRALDKPVTVQFRLLETEERTKPICVFWNHSIPCVSPAARPAP